MIHKRISPIYTKENGVWVLAVSEIRKNIPFEIIDETVVHIPPHQVAGQHSHLRSEAFVCMGEDVFLHWKHDQTQKSFEMNPEGNVFVCILPSGVAHAVENTSSNSVYLLEFADGPQIEVSPSPFTFS